MTFIRSMDWKRAKESWGFWVRTCLHCSGLVWDKSLSWDRTWSRSWLGGGWAVPCAVGCYIEEGRMGRCVL